MAIHVLYTQRLCPSIKLGLGKERVRERVTQLATGHVRAVDSEGMVAHGTPNAMVEHFKPALLVVHAIFECQRVQRWLYY